jgi:hypothetical protein
MALQHRWSAAGGFRLRLFDHMRVIVPDVVHTISGEKIEMTLPSDLVSSVPSQANMIRIHLQKFQQPQPSRVHAF